MQGKDVTGKAAEVPHAHGAEAPWWSLPFHDDIYFFLPSSS